MQAIKIRYNSEIISGILFMIIAATLWFLVPDQIITLEKSAVNAKTMPQIAIMGLLIFSFILFLQGIRLPKKELVFDAETLKSEGFKNEARTVIFALMLIVYAVLFNIIGYIVDTILLVVAILFFYYCKKWWYYAIAIVTVFIVYAVFTYLLNVNLPGFF